MDLCLEKSKSCSELFFEDGPVRVDDDDLARPRDLLLPEQPVELDPLRLELRLDELDARTELVSELDDDELELGLERVSGLVENDLRRIRNRVGRIQPPERTIGRGQRVLIPAQAEIFKHRWHRFESK